MLEGATYFVTLTMFAFVIFGTAYVRHDTLILACIPPMFVALIVGFEMWVYTYESFGPLVAVASLVVPLPVARQLARQFSVRDLLIAIYLAWALGMVMALVAFHFPDEV